MPRSRSRSRSRSRERQRASPPPRRRSRSRSPPPPRVRSRSRDRDRDRAGREPGRHERERERPAVGVDTSPPRRGGGNEDASPPRRQRPGGGARRDHTTSAFGEGQGAGKSFEQEARYDWGKPAEEGEEGEDGEKKPLVVDKPNFGLTGALAKDTRTGNVYKGVQLKWSEPDDARRPERGWRLYVFKNGEIKDTLHLHRQSAYLIGRHDVADLKIEHPSCSKQHAVIQFRERTIPGEAPGQTKHVVKPYIMDLESVNKTKLNGEELPPARYVELRPQDTVQFGLSTREYVLMHENMVG